VNNIDGRLTKLEQAARSIKGPLGPLVLMEGVHGTRKQILERYKASRSESRKGPLIIFAADRPDEQPFPLGVTRFDPEDVNLL
jgi:hypothetical protein